MNNYKIGRFDVSKELYYEYKKRKCFSTIFNLSIFWIGVAFATYCGLHFWFFIGKADEYIYKKGYLAACKDFYKGKLKADLITNPDGSKEWKIIKEISLNKIRFD